MSKTTYWLPKNQTVVRLFFGIDHGPVTKLPTEIGNADPEELLEIHEQAFEARHANYYSVESVGASELSLSEGDVVSITELLDGAMRFFTELQNTKTWLGKGMRQMRVNDVIELDSRNCVVWCFIKQGDIYIYLTPKERN